MCVCERARAHARESETITWNDTAARRAPVAPDSKLVAGRRQALDTPPFWSIVTRSRRSSIARAWMRLTARPLTEILD